MKKLIFIIIFFETTLSLSGQADSMQVDTLKNWNINGLASINFSQASFSDSWQTGGENSLAGLGLFNFVANYHKNKSLWESSLDAKYGFSKLDKGSPRKTDDMLDFSSRYGYQAVGNWFYSVSVGFRTQIAKGYQGDTSKIVNSHFLAPAYIVAALGIDYSPNANFSLALSPITARITIVNDTMLSRLGRFGVDPGEKARLQYGASLRSSINQEIMKNVALNSKLGLFLNYSDDTNLVADWQLLLNMKVNEILSANLVTQLLYDKSQIDKIQFKELIGIGFTYKFGKIDKNTKKKMSAENVL